MLKDKTKVPSERVTVVIRSSLGEDGPLTIRDAMRQILGIFDLLTRAQAEGDDKVLWQLVDISMASPLTATAEAFSEEPGYPVDPVVRAAKERLSASFATLIAGGIAPSWMDETTLEAFREIFERTRNGIGQTDIQLFPDASPIAIVRESARMGILAIDRTRLEEEARTEDLSHREIGSIEGVVTDATTYYRRPAIRIRERIEGRIILGLLNPELAAKVGDSHNWREVWDGQRVVVHGELFYGPNGKVSSINIRDIVPIKERLMEAQQIYDPGITGDMKVSEYIDNLWAEEDGE